MFVLLSMSLRNIKSSLIREYGLKLTKFGNRISTLLDTVFVNSTPGYYKSPFGRKRAIRWKKIVDTKTRVYALMYSIMFNPVGVYMVSLDHYSVFGWLLLAFGTFSTIFLFQVQFFDKEKQDEKNIEYETAITDLKERITKLEKK